MAKQRTQLTYGPRTITAVVTCAITGKKEAEFIEAFDKTLVTKGIDTKDISADVYQSKANVVYRINLCPKTTDENQLARLKSIVSSFKRILHDMYPNHVVIDRKNIRTTSLI